MKKLVQTLKNIWAIEELRNKIVITLALVLTYRIGNHIVLPGLDPNGIEAAQQASKSNGLLGIFDMFAGGGFSQASILALGIMPYISASIFMQLMTILVPQLQKVQKEGESGRKKINQWTRYLTVIVTIFQAAAYVGYLNSPGYAEAILVAYKPFFWFSTILTLTAGTLFVMWLGEKIQDKGLGNGTSIIIMVGILARLPQNIVQEFSAKGQKGGGGLLIFLIEIAILVTVIMALIILVQGVRKIPVNYAKQIIGNRQFGGARQFLPIKVNSAGVMPIIFAQAIMFLPTLVSFTNIDSAQGIVRIFNDHSNVWYMVIYSVMVIGFTFLYTALIFNPKQISEDLKRNNGFVPGVKPGQPTADYIGSIMDKITLPGAIFLALVGIMPGFAQRLGVTQGFSSFFGGTSLLIMVGVILDTLQQIETHLLMRQYDGLMNSGRVQGRQTVSTSTI
ncbi:MAG: preprotein translocase subunit SecY [Bacteroidetes bacterium 24-39-8]|nr:MAG: preprotein translocase subunit SecY [Sphingobacteriia bacterium 35-40-8]OYZ52717.1 MAG: preprotein translocase subunit SecY [Bacteroidetes bacterium 24-39-8]OZA68214.1 MAG: preprotein translocase subunit SecY [Sphingobacteriia bacterium 39-39-8]HQR91729.1 preprotein translocase subunit SecY [Sediminibacterium sp.]HQS54405.1 preprotein translocase subunit SecY [Sediminibacterium sp.]